MLKQVQHDRLKVSLTLNCKKTFIKLTFLEILSYHRDGILKIKPYICIMQKSIIDSFKILAGSFCFNSELVKRNYDVEGVHQLRVSVKKMRALVRMTKELYPEKPEQKISLRYLRKVFKSAALLRDIHIIKPLLNEYYFELLKIDTFKRFIDKNERFAKKQ